MVRVNYLRKCSNCKQEGHNSRTCHNNNVQRHNIDDENNIRIRLFGVDISHSPATDNKEESTKNTSLSLYNVGESSGTNGSNDVVLITPHDQDAGFLSDALLHSTRLEASHERIRGKWSEEEHRNFLIGLRVLGRGYWIGISTNFVSSRTPTQVASHAKYYMRRLLSKDKKRGSQKRSLFDIPFTQTSNRPMPLTNSCTAPSEFYSNYNVAKYKSSYSSTANSHSYGVLPPKSEFTNITFKRYQPQM